MRAVVCREYGPPEALVVEEVPDPELKPGCVAVDVAFAAVNFPDVLMIQNKYQVSIPTPFVPGNEFAGVVAAVGDGVTAISPGDHIFGATMVGGYAEKVVIPWQMAKVIQPHVRLDLAAAFWIAHATAYHGLRSIAEVAPGEKVAVLGAAGGVGLAAVEVARLLGAEVIAVASSADKLELCAERGATQLVNSTDGDVRDSLRAVAPDGIEVVFDPVGGPAAERALRTLRWKGRFVTVGYASGEIPRIPLNLVLLKGCIIRGFELRTFPFVEPELAARDEREMIEHLSTGRLVPHVSGAYPLERAAEALAQLSGRRSTGKVLLSMGEPPRTASLHSAP